MRSLAEIDADLRAAQLRVLELHAEHAEALKERNTAIVREFDAGKTQAEIARALKLPKSIVIGVVWRSGRTLSGRTAIAQQIRTATQTAEARSGGLP